MSKSGKKAAKREAQQARGDEQARQTRVRDGTERVNQTFSQFNDDFYGGRRDAYIGYARPQLDDQFADARNKLAFHLARSGLTDSSVRAQKEAELQSMYDTHSRSIADRGEQMATDARGGVEDARANLIRTLSSTGDADAAANQAISRASALSQPKAFDPLGQLFSDFTATLGTQAAMERAEAYGGPKARFNTGLFGARPGAVRND